ncbi:hypothetical protein K2173_019373 [Erythroxylum novogranatense]|uniref:C2H2-type domain-containing protein n=1 Tax=Erythroxylum novogranatense TaxID=1862640 RepID=A0AAV8UBB2_9ROSI|nr:hypothetical protein K2173_019373 [Erythroxylum novogranatense]
MKRVRENGEKESLEFAKCLILLSQTPEHKPIKLLKTETFECKTCNRKFPSFQALGGHRTSHNRSKLGEKSTKLEAGKLLSLATKPKVHECSICGLEFGLGQALGGHMRRHKLAMTQNFLHTTPVVSKPPLMPLIRRSNSCKRVFGLDLNLTPLENDLERVGFGKMAPKVAPLV